MKTRTPTATISVDALPLTPATSTAPTTSADARPLAPSIPAGVLRPVAMTPADALPTTFSSPRPSLRPRPQHPCPPVLPHLSHYNNTASILPGPPTQTTSYFPRSFRIILPAALGGLTSAPLGGTLLPDVALATGVLPALQSAGCATSYDIPSFPVSLSPSYAFLLAFYLSSYFYADSDPHPPVSICHPANFPAHLHPQSRQRPSALARILCLSFYIQYSSTTRTCCIISWSESSFTCFTLPTP